MRRKRFLSLLLMAALVMSLLPAAEPAQAAGGIWSGKAEKPPGWGTLQSPYLISTGEHLKWYADHVNSGGVGDPLPGNYYAVLMDDIVLNDTSNWQNWENSPPPNVWTPIGNAKNNFKATFDGMGHTISGIYINSTDSYQGLFGYLSPDDTVVIKNVKVARSYIRGDSYVGGICGYMNFFNKIIGCESDATVVGTQYTGGITGCVFNNSELTDCRNTGRVTGGICTGGIAGTNSQNGTITRCVNQGTVSGASYTGGLVGANDSVVSQSYNNGNVSGSGNYTGGICATNRGKIEHVYNSGSVSNGWPVCDQTFPGSSLTNVYYSGPPLNNGIHNHNGTGIPVNKSAEQFASGEVAYLMGALYGQTLSPGGDPLPVFRNADNSNQVFRLTYMNGTVVHKYQYYNAGAAVSSDDVEPPTRDDEAFSHWDGLPEIMPAEDVTVTANFTPSPPQITTASPLPSGIVHKAYSAKIEARGTKPITFTLLSGALPTGLTLDGNTGAITGTPAEAGSSTVTIRAQNQYGHNDKEFSITISDQMPGTGQSNDPYQIWTANHLIEFANKVNSSINTRYYAVLMADIELNDTSNWENWETNAPACTWTPIGTDSTYKFIGGFDGKNHTISGVYINGSGDYQGLFGYVDAATTIKNLNLAKSYIKGNENVGGICGKLMNLCKIENCRSAATVHGEKYVGGLCGSASSENASILNCQNEGTVTGSEWAGGIVGRTSGTVSGCRNSGTVQGSFGIGGICGNSSNTVTNVYNTGNVSGDTNIGGICGGLNGLTTKTVTLAGVYNSGNVTGLYNNAAICGVTNEYCQLSNCYYLDSSSASGIGYNPGNLTTVSKSAAQFASGEVAYLLGTAFGQTLNTDAYPVFRSSDGSNAVYRLLYMNETQQHAAQYYNAGTTISAAGISTPSKSGHYFSHWDGLPSSMPAEDVTVSAVFLPIKAPSEPQNLTAIPGDGQVILSWTAPADNGGSANIEYEVSRDNGANWTDVGSATGYTFTGLTNGQSYIFGVRAVNEAGAGPAATTSATPQATPPAISPTLLNFDLNDPADLTTVITWNSATSVTSVVYGAYTLVEDTDFTIHVNDLIIKHSYLLSLSPTTGAALDIVITFNTGDKATLTVNVVNNYVKSSNANLRSLSVNGTPVNGFDPDVIVYDVELPYGTTSATVTATVEDPLASCVINNASVLPGSATVTVTAEDGTTKTYTINFTIGAAPFIAVTNITNVPAAATAGTTLTLTGTVVPANATNQTIIWSIQNPGTTGAMISGNTLSVAAAGTVIVRATIINGASESMDYIQDFSITVTTAPVTRYTITASAGSGGSISPSGAVSVVSGGSQTFTIIPDSGYRIDAVTVDGVNQGAVTTYTFTNVIADHTINATFTRTSSGGGPTSSTPPTPATPSYEAVVKVGKDTETMLPITLDKDSETVSVNTGSLGLDKDGTVITIPSIPDVNTYTVGISVTELSTSDVRGTLTLATDVGSVTVPSNMLTGVLGISGSKAEISIGKGDKDNLPADLKAAIGDKPLIQLTLSIDGKQTDWSNPNASVTVSIPYTPTEAELANPESIVIWYIDGNGNAVCIPNGHYDPVTGTVTFTTTHFSRYAVVYKRVSFSDVPAGAWYAGAVRFIAARDITSGTGAGRFSPGAKLTRSEFIVMLMKAYGIAPDTNPTDNFSDSGRTWYTGYLAAAKRLGITSGTGGNMFMPGKEITRQEMFTLLCNTLKIIGQMPAGYSGRTLSDFSDAGQIAPWAKDSMAFVVQTGIAGGSGGRLNPTGITTRAEMAQVLKNLMNL